MAKVLRRQLSALDAGFDYAERVPAAGWMNGGIVYVFDADAGSHPQSTQEMAEWLADRVQCSPLFSRRIWHVPLNLDHPYWQDVNDLEPSSHVRVSSVHAAGWEAFHKALIEAVHVPLDRTRPMWDLHVITGIRGVEGFPSNAVAVLHRIHHTAADGMSNATLSHLLFSRTHLELEPMAPVEAPSASVAMLRGLVRLPVSLGRYARRALRFARTPDDDSAKKLNGDLKPRTRFNQPLLGRASVARASFDLNEAKAVGRALGPFTLNDVLLATVAGALRAYLADVGELPTDSLVTDVPKSLRNAQDATGGNAIVTMEVPLRTDLADPRARLRGIKTAVDEEKLRALAPKATARRAVIEAMPAPLMSLLLRPRGTTPTEPLALDQPTTVSNTLVTNIPFGAPDFYFGDAPVRDVFGVYEIRPGSCLKHMVTSIGDRITITVTVDDHAMPDVRRYGTFLERAYEELAEAAGLR